MNNRKIIILSCLFVVATVCAYIFFRHDGIPVNVPPKSAGYFSILDGLPVTSTDQVVPQVLGIMIDNHPDARPQYGLLDASVVYEAPVEGGITRYFAIFDASRDVAKVGPVRSARAYFIDWIREYGAAPYLHSGGSPEALAILANDDEVWDANEFSRGQYFWRGKESLAPHNLYTSSTLWNDLIDHYGQYFPARPWQGLTFDTSTVEKQTRVSSSSVSIAFAPGYSVSWKYSDAVGRYLRFINSKQVFDPSGKPIVADTVLVQRVNMKTIDEVGRKDVDTVGSGPAMVFMRGAYSQSVWEKPSLAERTVFYNTVANEPTDVVKLAPGVTWIEVVPKDIKIEE